MEVIIYEPVLDAKQFEGFRVVDDSESFKAGADVIVANRMEEAFLTSKKKCIHEMYFAEINIIDESSLRERWDQNVSDSTFSIIFNKKIFP